jgi:hypothetical protein
LGIFSSTVLPVSAVYTRVSLASLSFMVVSSCAWLAVAKPHYLMASIVTSFPLVSLFLIAMPGHRRPMTKRPAAAVPEAHPSNASYTLTLAPVRATNVRCPVVSAGSRSSCHLHTFCLALAPTRAAVLCDRAKARPSPVIVQSWQTGAFSAKQQSRLTVAGRSECVGGVTQLGVAFRAQ